MVKKHSRQREAIINEVKSRYDHPTANDIYSSLRERYPNISLGTVYRNLSDLADSGEILRLPDSKGPDRFDGNPDCHYHFQCLHCYCVSDIDMAVKNKLNKLAQEALNAKIFGHNLVFYGVCNKCKI